MSQKKIYEVVVNALNALPFNKQLARGRWGYAGEDTFPSCLVGAIGLLYAKPSTYGELNPRRVAPLIRNGAAGVVDDFVLDALNRGFEGSASKDFVYGWNNDLDESLQEKVERFSKRASQQHGLHMFCLELGRAVYRNRKTRKLPSLNVIQKRARQRND